MAKCKKRYLMLKEKFQFGVDYFGNPILAFNVRLNGAVKTLFKPEVTLRVGGSEQGYFMSGRENPTTRKRIQLTRATSNEEEARKVLKEFYKKYKVNKKQIFDFSA